MDCSGFICSCIISVWLVWYSPSLFSFLLRCFPPRELYHKVTNSYDVCLGEGGGCWSQLLLLTRRMLNQSTDIFILAFNVFNDAQWQAWKVNLIRISQTPDRLVDNDRRYSTSIGIPYGYSGRIQPRYTGGAVYMGPSACGRDITWHHGKSVTRNFETLMIIMKLLSINYAIPGKPV